MNVAHVDEHQFTPIKDFSSRGAFIAALLPGPQEWAVSLLRLSPNGILGLHPASSDQLMIVIEGRGRVRVPHSPSIPIRPGTIVLWERGEEHETAAGPTGLSALVIEGDNLASAFAALQAQPPTKQRDA